MLLRMHNRLKGGIYMNLYKTIFKCSLCGKEYTDWDRYKKHLQARLDPKNPERDKAKEVKNVE